ERAAGRVEERTVAVERAVLDRDGNLIILRPGWVAELRGGARQHAGWEVIGASPQVVEAGRPGVDVEAGHAQGVVVVPEGRCALGVLGLEHRRARPPGLF